MNAQSSPELWRHRIEWAIENKNSAAINRPEGSVVPGRRRPFESWLRLGAKSRLDQSTISARAPAQHQRLIERAFEAMMPLFDVAFSFA